MAPWQRSYEPRADIVDLRVQTLANDIIRAQRKEIQEMEWLIQDIRENGPVTTEAEKAARPLPKFEGSLNPAGGPDDGRPGEGGEGIEASGDRPR